MFCTRRTSTLQLRELDPLRQHADFPTAAETVEPDAEHEDAEHEGERLRLRLAASQPVAERKCLHPSSRTFFCQNVVLFLYTVIFLCDIYFHFFAVNPIL